MVISLTSQSESVTATDLPLPVPAIGQFERYEGMLVHFTQPLTVNDTFTLGRFGEVRLAQGGRLYNPTAITEPGAPAIAQKDLNDRRSFVLDDGDNRQNIDPTLYPLGGLSAANTLRSGYTVNGLTAVFDERFSSYRAQPIGSVAFSETNPRTAAPPSVGGNLKVASFNVLNFFNGNGTGGGFPTARGANTLAELNRQKAKEVSALAALDADIVGLMEIENDTAPNSAVEELVAAVNAQVGAGTYAFIDTGVIGTDEIRVALIYKPSRVTPVGAFKVLTSAIDPRFIDTRSRPSLAQTFELNATNRRITIDVNHLKSKGSACADIGDPDTGDGQGNCNLTRKNAAEAIVDWLATDPTGSGSADTLVIGDLNAYTFEDPIEVFTNAGYANLVRNFGGLAAYSYIFDGESGYLDHALATPSLAPKVTGTADWHINADEPIVLDYNTEFKTPGQISSFYDPGPYRSSDHDPVLVGISLPAKVTPSLTTSASPPSVVLGGSISDAATLSGGNAPSGSITFKLYGPDDPDCVAAPVSTTTVAVSSGNGTYTSPSYTPAAAGTYRWVAGYGGDADNNAVTGSCGDSNESAVVVTSGPLPTAPICVATSARYSGTASGQPEQQVTIASSIGIATIDNVAISNGTVHTGGATGPLVPLAPGSLTLPPSTQSFVLTAVQAAAGSTQWSFRATDQDSNQTACVFAMSSAVATVLGAAAMSGAAPAARSAPDRPIAVVGSSVLQRAFVSIDGAPRYSFADSDLLANSLRQGVRGVDVYAGAGSQQPQALYRERRVAKPVSFASDRLVLIVPRSNRRRVRSVSDLRRRNVSLMLGSATVSFGNQSRTVLTRLKLGAAIKRAKPGVGDPARLASQIAARKADAAIVYATSITASVKRKLRVIAIPAKGRPKVTFQIAVVTGAPNRTAASAFIRKVRSRAGQAALKRAGFKQP